MRASAPSQTERATADCIQVFVYRVPKKNHEAFAETEGRLADLFRKAGITNSEFFTLKPARIFGGFTNVAESVSAGEDEELWLEVDSYRDEQDRDEVVKRIGQDPAARPLFQKVLSLCAPGSQSLQGDFVRTEM
jgi:uncharacterized protein YbaA (DUF1428 family)